MENISENSRPIWLIRLEAVEDNMTASERRISNYFKRNPDNVISMSITEVADACDTSESTIVRFCRHIGYKGFQDIKIAVAQSRVPTLQVMYEGITEKSTIAQIKDQVFSCSIAAMQDTMKILDENELERAVDAICGARSIDIYAMGGSYVIAEDAKHKLMKVGIRCQVYCDSHCQVLSASQLGTGDVAIGISYSGSSKDVVEALELARGNGATTIAITHISKSPILRASDIVLHVTAQDMKFRSDGIVSRMAQLAIVDVLYTGVGLRLGQQAMDTLERGRIATTNKSC